MTVKELIEKLQGQDPEASVWVVENISEEIGNPMTPPILPVQASSEILDVVRDSSGGESNVTVLIHPRTKWTVWREVKKKGTLPFF